MRVQLERALSNSRRKLPKGDNSPPNGRRGRRGEIRRSWTRLSTLATFVARQRDGGQTGSDFSSVYRSFHRHYLSAAARRKHLFRIGILGRRVMRYRYIYKITSAASLACLTLLRLLGPPTSRPVTRSFVPTSLSRIPLSFSLSLSLLLPIAVYRSVIERFLPSRKVLLRLEISLSLSLCQRSMPWNTAVRKLENHNRELSRGKY